LREHIDANLEICPVVYIDTTLFNKYVREVFLLAVVAKCRARMCKQTGDPILREWHIRLVGEYFGGSNEEWSAADDKASGQVVFLPGAGRIVIRKIESGEAISCEAPVEGLHSQPCPQNSADM
jgi:hypothetical protein